MIAAGKGHADTVRLLLEKGANVDATIREGKLAGSTALSIAQARGHTNIANMLRAAGAK